MLKTFSALAGVCALALAAPLAAQAPVPTAAAPAKLPTMSFGTWGFDPASLDPSIDPGDDFFAFANKRWLEANPLPPEFSRFGSFNLLAEKATADVKALVDELLAKNPAALTADEKRIVDAYRAFEDTDAIDRAGLAPAQPYIARIKAADSIGELATLWAEPGIPSPFGGGINVDAKEPTRYSVYLSAGGLGLPDRDNYLKTTPKDLEIQAKYKEYLGFLLAQAGYADPAGMAQQVYALEDQIARTVAWDRATRRNRDLTYNALTPAQLAALDPAFPIGGFIEASGFGKTDRFIVGDLPPSEARLTELRIDPPTRAKIGGGTPAMLKLLRQTPVEVLQAWTIKSFIEGNAPVLSTALDKAVFAFRGTVLNGTPEQRPRWKRAIDEAEGLLGERIGAAYVARHFPPANKAAMDQLIGNLRKAMAISIEQNDWMSAATKKEALAKLQSFDPKIGYRDNLESYEGLTIVAGAPLANRMAARRWEWQDDLKKLGGPIDRTEWAMLPQTVNAYYNSTKNEIVFPAGILQQPFFGLTADAAVNYGAIGAVIGHEMGHGFDDQGSKSDGTGMLRNWWTDADRAAFDKRGDMLVAQYNAFCPLDEGKTCVNGRLSLGENIGDVGGLSLAYRAYKLSLGGKEDKVIDGLTGDQRFFLAWAQIWRAQTRERALRQRLITGPHSPEEYRVNGVVRQMDAWYKAFNVTPDDALYLPPDQRVVIW
jgi:putative endopeptidase